MPTKLKTEHKIQVKKDKEIEKIYEIRETCTNKDLKNLDIEKLISDNHNDLVKYGTVEIKIEKLKDYVKNPENWTKSKADITIMGKYFPKYGILLKLNQYDYVEDCLTISIPKIHPYISRTFHITMITTMIFATLWAFIYLL